MYINSQLGLQWHRTAISWWTWFYGDAENAGLEKENGRQPNRGWKTRDWKSRDLKSMESVTKRKCVAPTATVSVTHIETRTAKLQLMMLPPAQMPSSWPSPHQPSTATTANCEVGLIAQRDERIALVPCGHRRFCETCANEVERQGRGCPICRTDDLRLFWQVTLCCGPLQVDLNNVVIYCVTICALSYVLI